MPEHTDPPIVLLLKHYGAELPRYRRPSKWNPMRCPFHGDERASAAVNEEAGRFMCHGCMTKSEDLIGLVQWWEGIGYREAVERCESITGTSNGELHRSAPRRSGLSALFG